MVEQRTTPRIVQIIAETIGTPSADIDEVHTLVALGADSFHFVELVAHLETEFRIELPYELSEVGNQTVADYVRAVHHKLKGLA